MSATDDLLTNNARFATGYVPSGRAAPPAKRVVVVTCMDARIDPVQALGLEEGDAHVLRNAGGAVTDDVVRSLLLSQRLLGTIEIVLVHHTGCGMLTVDEDELANELEADTGLRPPFRLEAFTSLEADLRLSASRLRKNPFVDASQLRAFVYDVETGRLREVEV